MDESDKQDIVNQVEADEAGGSLIVTLIVILLLCGGGYWFYNSFSKTHNLPAAGSALNNAENVRDQQTANPSPPPMK